ncbi:MAG TPA: 4Fe-4S binding protein, partial [Candidatus Brocadiaceae bacterium]
DSCIACKQCEKICPYDAIHVQNNLAVIDYGKCTSCGKCVEVCPNHTIINFARERSLTKHTLTV